MRNRSFEFVGMAALVFFAFSVMGQGAKAQTSDFRLDSLDGLQAVNSKPEVVTYRGRRAVRILQSSEDPATNVNGASLAILKAADFKDGTIEVEVAGGPRTGAPADSRGFIGIAFRVGSGLTKYECFYVRMTNGRADDQLRRNHATQYISEPEYPWERLRKENPGVYESYVDLEAGAWTKLKIVVSGAKAKLYVNGADQPTLIVNDLKLGESHGPIALWVGSDSDAYFSNLSVK